MKNGRYACYFNNIAHGDDAWLVRHIDRYSVLDAVLDGVSTRKGSTASTLTANRLRTGRIRTPDDAAKLLQEANEELFEKTHGRSQTTATIALKIGDELYVINAGDSPSYLMTNGDCVQLAILDKSPNNHVAITNSVGKGVDFVYHINHIHLLSGDRLVIATDGITDNLYPNEIADEVYKRKTPQGAANGIGRLLERKKNVMLGRHDVFGRFKNDDATAIVRYFP